MTKLRPLREKAQANARYAAKFPRRDRKAKRKARKARVLARELAWLLAHNIDRDKEHPLA